ncbi:hypothetical protein ONS95_006196 [Cadophora gregata]|uniref:uncharacterized protein n=1 Tax=Cadophora gregata TaxID=51156 RepID=UPI0026DB6059|nr:uncharacterized protein ONS95_006196 [Cadophora gregata]KAK0102585.1 hypothetical protein ONS95_006196 [Cadophora gregata]
MASKKTRFGNFFRFLSPGSPSRPPSPPIRYPDFDGNESQSQLTRDYEGQEATAHLPSPQISSALVPARPTALLPISTSPMYREQGYQEKSYSAQQTYPLQQQCHAERRHRAQQSYASQQTYRHHPTNPAYSTSVPTAYGHVCQLCVATERFAIRPTRCPFTGEQIGLPNPQQGPRFATKSSMYRSQRSHFEPVEFVDVQAGEGDDEITEHEFNGEDWTRHTSREEHVEYIGDRRRRMIEDWMDRYIYERCPGWGDQAHLDVWRRSRWQEGRGYEGMSETDEASEADAWRMLDEVWRV